MHIFIALRKHLQSFKTIHGNLESCAHKVSTVYALIPFHAPKKKTSQTRKIERKKVLYHNYMHIFIPCRKHPQSFKICGKPLEELHPQGTHCLYTLMAFQAKKETWVHKEEKVRKIIKRIYPDHMHVIPCKKHLKSFKTICGKLRGVAPTG